MDAYNLLVSGPLLAIFSPRVGGVVVVHLLFRFSVCWSVPVIFAIKVKSWQKLRQILNVFCLPTIWGAELVFYYCFYFGM